MEEHFLYGSEFRSDVFLVGPLREVGGDEEVEEQPEVGHWKENIGHVVYTLE